MKIEIQGYWNAKVRSLQTGTGVAEEVIQKQGYINVCDIIIDGALWEIRSNGKELQAVKG